MVVEFEEEEYWNSEFLYALKDTCFYEPYKRLLN